MSAQTAPGPAAARASQAFRATFGRPHRLFRAPGRVNLIGEHTDYNDGFVLPLAIDRATYVAAGPRADRKLMIVSVDLAARTEIDLDGPRGTRAGDWGAYIEGVARVLEAGGARLGGAEIVVASDVPFGAGLSSSAALEMASGLALLALAEQPIDPIQLALAGQRAEHEYVGTRCGIMDQYVSALARAGHALLIDCRSLEARPIPLELPGHEVVILDSGVKHSLASGEYNARRADCEEGVRLLQKALPDIRALRDVSAAELSRHGAALPERIRKRCRHVVTENERTLAAVGALVRGDLPAAGQMMAASHASLRDDYEVSCEELDALVADAAATPGVVGARMTGGGFGGCTVNLVARDAVESTIARVSAGYQRRFGRAPGVLVTGASSGAAEVEVG